MSSGVHATAVLEGIYDKLFHGHECPPASDGFDRFACPSPDTFGRYKCIDAHALCDGYIDCPEKQDEDRMACMFFKTQLSLARPPLPLPPRTPRSHAHLLFAPSYKLTHTDHSTPTPGSIAQAQIKASDNQSEDDSGGLQIANSSPTTTSPEPQTDEWSPNSRCLEPPPPLSRDPCFRSLSRRSTTSK
ncbi:unnamed protein product [Cyprideis torosa]|uniref:Uncharacterized protein n=1 Tax=Cyprideis torosa TaxID=163714 RepID=A0A7R8W7L9_9CRUS|nr:unnamed protein product [Cyprideis torosa]CAG0886483.1 unnamed protein product [Cyprideis torosa]